MQMQLPIFPREAKLINANVGVYERDNFIYYLHNGSPVFCHEKEDSNSYRYITGNLVETRLCKCTEIAKALGVSSRNIQRYAKSLRENGSEWFFSRPEQRGSCHKLNEERICKAQALLDKFYPVAEVARSVGVTEGALRYHIRKGSLKKKRPL
jgi:transposase